MKNLAYLVALQSVDGLGPVRLRVILKYFQDPKLAWLADTKEIQSLGIPSSTIEKLKTARRVLDPDSYLQTIQNSGVKILTVFDNDYPKRLTEIHDPPLIIFYKGEIIEADFDKVIGVVGTRRVTGYGQAVTEQLTRDLVTEGFTIVSGLARGVDTIAHWTTVNAQGRTYAVLGGGVNVIYPPENAQLASKIASKFGAYLSEYPPNYPSYAGNFPARNRIISGLSTAVLVTEAAENSGSLITARLAIEQGREVFAVPGPITSAVSKGPADLIKDGAKLTYSVDDILEELGFEKGQTVPKLVDLSQLTKFEQTILACLEVSQNESHSKQIDEICRELKIKSEVVTAALLKMEILGLIKNLGSGNYQKLI